MSNLSKAFVISSVASVSAGGDPEPPRKNCVDMAKVLRKFNCVAPDGTHFKGTTTEGGQEVKKENHEFSVNDEGGDKFKINKKDNEILSFLSLKNANAEKQRALDALKKTYILVNDEGFKENDLWSRRTLQDNGQGQGICQMHNAGKPNEFVNLIFEQPADHSNDETKHDGMTMYCQGIVVAQEPPPENPPQGDLENATKAKMTKADYKKGTFECSLDNNGAQFFDLKTDKIVIEDPGKVTAWPSLNVKAKVYNEAGTEVSDSGISFPKNINQTNPPQALDDALGPIFKKEAQPKEHYDIVLKEKTLQKLTVDPQKVTADTQTVAITCKDKAYSSSGPGNGNDDGKKDEGCCTKKCCIITCCAIAGVALIGGIAAYFLLANKGDDAGDEEEEEEDEEGEGDEE